MKHDFSFSLIGHLDWLQGAAPLAAGCVPSHLAGELGELGPAAILLLLVILPQVPNSSWIWQWFRLS